MPNLDPVEVDLDEAFVESVVRSGATHMGIVGINASSLGFSFWTLEAGSWAQPPRLEITYILGLPVPGDFDADGDVDLEDFVILKRNFLHTGVTARQGDCDGDGDVDLDDFVIFKRNFDP